MKKTFIIYLLTLSAILSLSLTAKAQCYMDQHSTNWFDNWSSCEKAESPNPERAASHWIMYDLKKVFALGQTKVWNINDPKNLSWGLRDVVIDISEDGMNWQEVGEYQWSIASGLSKYEGEDGPNFQNAEGRYVLITAINNHGGQCYGFGEIRIEAEPVEIISNTIELSENECFKLQAFPNPFVENVRVELAADCLGDIRYEVVDVLGRQMTGGIISPARGKNQLPIRMADLKAGTYFLTAFQGEKRAQISLVKM